MCLNKLYKEHERLERIIGTKTDNNGTGWGEYVYMLEDRKQAKEQIKKLEKDIEALELI